MPARPGQPARTTLAVSWLAAGPRRKAFAGESEQIGCRLPPTTVQYRDGTRQLHCLAAHMAVPACRCRRTFYGPANNHGLGGASRRPSSRLELDGAGKRSRAGVTARSSGGPASDDERPKVAAVSDPDAGSSCSERFGQTRCQFIYT
ncbi:hypothetical protein GUJ93_ZPchr0013g35946 [Zizania palustris]|uniref:Uncharacterized protein n=1 Tax=Zizania palustris TaxID=103762 RepID=A0A8J5WXB9_ZIZPA|nr:hypothetical protein GUJ93_ZPchr0013g35946 [Zizania palustris]